MSETTSSVRSYKLAFWLVLIALFGIGGYAFYKAPPDVSFLAKGNVSLLKRHALPTVEDFEVLESKELYLRVSKDGKIELRTGGNITWRTNNPAKIRWGKFAESQGGHQPGKDQSVAIFSSEEAGIEANRKLLFDTPVYSGLTLKDAIYKYAPANYGYSPASYLAKVKSYTNIDENKVLNSFSKSEQDSLMNAIKLTEGWTPGVVTVFQDSSDFARRGW